jgi:peptidoglycan L-alanyl-D-glutamate endopeptidase CwlK
MFGVALYMTVAIAALALLCLPGVRAHAQKAWMQGRLALRLRCAQLRARLLLLGRAQAQARAWLAAQAGAPTGTRMASVLPVPGRWALVALSVLLVVPGLALLLRHWHVYDGFDHTRSREADARVVTLLRGEQLVPPPRLPPELFSTREVEQARPLVATASRQWELLDHEFRQRLLEVFQVMRERHGYEMVLIEGYRSPERQMQLASLGRHVTHAGAGQSYHQFGLAADCAFLRDGRVVIDERDPWAAQGYALYGAVAQAAGLQWGGAWRTLLDLGHVELPRHGRLQRVADPA